MRTVARDKYLLRDAPKKPRRWWQHGDYAERRLALRRLLDVPREAWDPLAPEWARWVTDVTCPGSYAARYHREVLAACRVLARDPVAADAFTAVRRLDGDLRRTITWFRALARCDTPPPPVRTVEQKAAERAAATAALVARRAARSAANLARAEADLARAERRVARWREKVRYYEKKTCQSGGTCA